MERWSLVTAVCNMQQILCIKRQLISADSFSGWPKVFSSVLIADKASVGWSSSYVAEDQQWLPSSLAARLIASLRLRVVRCCAVSSSWRRIVVSLVFADPWIMRFLRMDCSSLVATWVGEVSYLRLFLFEWIELNELNWMNGMHH